MKRIPHRLVQACVEKREKNNNRHGGLEAHTLRKANDNATIEANREHTHKIPLEWRRNHTTKKKTQE